MSRLLYSVEDVFSSSGYLQSQDKKYYNIPLYQRGYKWEPRHIEKLLDDIDNFESEDGKFYCLQNITLVPNGKHFNVVDGQQRLTTLTLILSYLSARGIVYNKVRFPENSIRKETNKFLNAMVTVEGVQFPELSWDEFIREYEDYDHQDIGHLYRGYQAVVGWFKKYTVLRAGSETKFLDKLLNDVKFIINKVESTDSEEKIFGNLNSKRVPLDGADLIRAMLITRVAHEEGKKESDIKNIVRVNERRVKIGWELDQINQWWSKTEVIAYFSSFKSAKSAEAGAGNKLFNDDLYPINLLYLLFAEKRGKKELTLELIEENNNDALGLYKELLKLHYTLQDWFAHKKIYHFLGYLFNHLPKRDWNFVDAWKLWDETDSRKEFIGELKNKIRESISIEDALVDFNDEETDWYKDRPEILVRSLILMDIIHSLKEDRENLPVVAFTKSNNDIEHIFPQTPEKVAAKKDFIDFLNKNVVRHGEIPFDLSNFDKNKNNEDYQELVDEFIDDHVASIRTNSIGNLVLLYSSLNRSIKNSTYSVKRGRIIQYFQEGHFIQPHTFQVFIRYFNDKNDQNFDVKHWTNNDIAANANFISHKINAFFTQLDEL
ncbi:Protein of unknown function [Mucilaginibacter gossypiicola]|uniref:DUF262 domain-containing protein n=1 Tax=Mucilaginibacter gossypiicola TaxID=551995 RepID=A0A1H8RFP0_9SPHI|nr:DUF262 domain-containing protein [Mucilaginibacter gossypiicola]SEO65152.1 Protein of unknown function [Mucilaginibacter gossypiicola]